MKLLLRLLVLGSLVGASSLAAAQTSDAGVAEPLPAAAPPAGPADVIGGANQAREDSAAQRAVRSGPPQVDAQARRAMQDAPPAAITRPNRSIPAGSIVVQVLDPAGRPVAGAAVRVGIMAQAGDRASSEGETDAGGMYVVTDQPTGAIQAYRVTVPHEGAVYGATPFRLEPDQGQEVRVRLLPTTRDAGVLLQLQGQTVFEFRENRLHVVQQTQLTNLGEATYVFPEGGLQVDLPPGFVGFQSQAVMTDQRIIPNDDGFELRGSLMPGRVTLTWGYDLDLDTGTTTVRVPMPFRTYRYRVMTDAAPGMTLEVEGFPEAQSHESDGRSMLFTQVERTPEDPALDHLVIRLRGVPGPGPLRWVALGAALILIFAGLLFAMRGGDRAAQSLRAREARKAELLDDAADLEAMFASGEVGAKFRHRRLEEIANELAAILRIDAAAVAMGQGGKGSRSAAAAKAARTKRR